MASRIAKAKNNYSLWQRETFDDGKNRYRNRGILRSAYSTAAITTTAGIVAIANSIDATAATTLTAAFLPATIAADQAVAAYGNLSGNYRKYAKEKQQSARDLGWWPNRKAAVGFTPPHPLVD